MQVKLVGQLSFIIDLGMGAASSDITQFNV